MTLPSLPTFRIEHAPPPLMYVDTDPEGKRVDPRLALGNVAVLTHVRDAVVSAGVGTFIADDLARRIKIETGQELPGEYDETIDPLVLQGEEARQVRSLYDKVVKHGSPSVGRVERAKLKWLGRHMLDQNQVPVIGLIDGEYEKLIADARVKNPNHFA